MACATPAPPVEPPQPPVLPVATLSSPPRIENPDPEPDPQVQMVFDRLEAQNTEHITLYFLLLVDNPRSGSASMGIRRWQLMVNGLIQDKGADPIFTAEVAAAASAQFPLQFAVDLGASAGSGEAEFDTYQITLETDMVFTYADANAVTHLVAEAAFPRIREPQFTVTTIVVNQGDLINTRLKVGLRIDNPNQFPLQLSALAYQFYGDERFWADGNDPTIRHIPAMGSAQTQISMVMNFINMNRKLLEDIIAAKQIYYRFTGEAAVLTTIEYLPQFSMDFDLSGNSVVVK